MSAKIQKTNAVRLLEQAGVEYEAVSYDVDPDDLGAVHLASTLGLDAGRVFKTLVLRGEKTGLFVCVVPGDAEVDLKKAAAAAGDKKAAMIAMKELLPLTGYMRGGCSAIGMKRPLPVYYDVAALRFDSIYVSGGRRGLQLRVDPRRFFALASGTAADLVADRS